jgi:hypothetical protein
MTAAVPQRGNFLAASANKTCIYARKFHITKGFTNFHRSGPAPR